MFLLDNQFFMHLTSCFTAQVANGSSCYIKTVYANEVLLIFHRYLLSICDEPHLTHIK